MAACCATRQRLHAEIAEALGIQSPELMDTQPEIFDQHYAEAGLLEKSVAFWGKAGRRFQPFPHAPVYY